MKQFVKTSNCFPNAQRKKKRNKKEKYLFFVQRLDHPEEDKVFLKMRAVRFLHEKPPYS